ncbi:MAG: thiamine pyrophosphate-dependent enzyme [Halovenus sp.]
MERGAELPDDWRRTIGTAGRSTPGDPRLRPDEQVIDDAVDLYLESGATVPPLVLAGDGAVRADAKPAIESFAERTNAILATTLQAQGYFADHPYSVGFVGTFGPTLANEYFTHSDYVLAVGCSLNDHTTDNGRLVDEDTTVVHVDHDRAAIERHNEVDLAVVGDARVTVERLTDALAGRGIDFEGKFWTDRLERRIASASVWGRQDTPNRPDRIDPRDLVTELDTVLPADRFVVTDGGHFINWVLDGITTTHPDDYEWTIDFGAVGVGLPIALGATFATDDRTVVAFCGDAGFMMSIQELDTAVRQEIPVVVVVMNDDALGSEYQQLQNKGIDPDAAVVETPDFAAVAGAHGVDGCTIRSVDDVDALRGKLETGVDGPVVADCRINRDVRHRFYDTDHMM